MMTEYIFDWENPRPMVEGEYIQGVCRKIGFEEYNRNTKVLVENCRRTRNMMIDSIYMSDIAVGARVLGKDNGDCSLK